MARAKKSDDGSVNDTGAESVAEKSGRALVDIPSHELKSGDYATLPADVADTLERVGAFDTQAIEVKE